MAFKKIRKVLVGIILAGLLYFGGCASNKSWSKGHILYNNRDRHIMYKLEGNTQFTEKGPNLWGFIETRATKNHSGDTENFFVKARADQKIINGLNISAEHTAGNYFVDYTKAGIIYKKKFGKKGPFIMAKAYPVRTDRKDDTTLGVLISQQIIPDKLSATAWLDRDIRGETYVGEASLDYKLLNNLNITTGARSAGSIHKEVKLNPYLGIKYNF